MQVCFIYGAVFIGSIALSVYIANVVVPGSAFTNLIEVIVFILNFPQSAAQGVPATFTSMEALRSAVITGSLTWQAAGIALIVVIAVFLGVLGTAYTKALVLAVMENVAHGRRTRFIDMFRGGRSYWKPAIWYYSIFGFFTWLLLLCIVPALVLLVGNYVHGEQQQAPLPSIVWWMLAILIVAFVARIATIFADYIITSGSKSPVRDSLAYAKNHGKDVGIMSASLLVVAFVMILINLGLDWVSSVTGVALIASVVWILLFVLWRLWVAAFVVFQGHSRNRGHRTPRGA